MCSGAQGTVLNNYAQRVCPNGPIETLELLKAIAQSLEAIGARPDLSEA